MRFLLAEALLLGGSGGPPAASAIARAAPLDRAALARLQASLPGPAWRGFVHVFIDQGGAHVQRMEDGLVRRDLGAVGLAAHALKPTSALLGAGDLSLACRVLEEATRDAQGGLPPGAANADLEGLVQRVRGLFEAVAGALRQEARE